jgi:mannose-6-phosphate isomerase-like protein (cupin superfamily)
VRADTGSANKHKRDRQEENAMSLTQTIETSKTQAILAPFPNTKGTVTLKVLNSDQSLGPAVALLRMEPGSEIPRHLHEHTTELSYVLEGDFINEGIAYSRGTEINVKPMTAHGPHTTKNGCSVLVTFSYPSTLDDFQLA